MNARTSRVLVMLVVMLILSANIIACGDDSGGNLACKVTCSDVDDVAACEAKCVELLNSNETLTEALDTN